VASRQGVDAGVDLTTSGVAEIVRQRVREKTGAVLRDNVHGVDVFLDDPAVRLFNLSATGTVSKNPEPFLSDISKLFPATHNASATTRDTALLLNFALMRPEPVAQIVYAISAVEMLGQSETWSAKQREVLERLARAAENEPDMDSAERRELADAIRRGTHKLSLRQGALRLLASVGLGHLRKEWEEVYAERSTLVHGLAPRPGVDYGKLAFRTVSLCGHVLLRVIAKEIPGADTHVDTFYAITA
jgi:hypothetical protein